MNRNVEKFEKRPGRPFTVGGVRWKVKVGKSCVVAYSEKGQHITSSPWAINGTSPSTWERGQWKRTSDGALQSAEICAWLASNKL